MSSRDSNRGRGDSRGGRRDSVTGSRPSTPTREGSRPTTPTGAGDAPPRSRSPQRSPSPERSGRGGSSARGQSSGPPRGGPQQRGGSQSRGGAQQHGGSGGPRLEYQSTPTVKADRQVMFNASPPDKQIADFEKKSLESKKNIKQEPQRDLRDKKTKAERGQLPIHVDLVRRPGYGTKGKSTNVRANFFAMIFKPDAKFYAYSVNIVPEPTHKRHIRQIFKQLVLRCPEIKDCLPATDEAQWIVTCKPIPFEETTVRCDPTKCDPGEKEWAYTYTVSFTLQDKKPIPLKGLLDGLANPDIHEKVTDEDYVVQLLNIFMTSFAYGDPGVTNVGKGRLKFFYTDNRQESMNLTGGLEVLRGVISSVRPAAKQILLNLGVSNGAFYQHMNLGLYIEEVLRANFNDLETVNRYLRTVKIELRHSPKIYDDDCKQIYRVGSVWGLASKEDETKYVPNKDSKDKKDHKPPQVKSFGAGPDDVRFWLIEEGKPGRYVTVTEFFKQKYGVILKDKKKPVVNIGNHQRAVYIPSESAWIKKGHVFNGELSTAQRQNIIKFSCRQPPDNFETIRTLGRGIMGMSGNYFRDRQIKFSDEMLVVPARVLDAPVLKYGTRTEKPQRGAWNLVGKQFSTGVSIETWVVLWIKAGVTRTTPDQVQTAVEGFRKKMAEMGMRVAQRPSLESIDIKGPIKDQCEALQARLISLSAKNPHLLLVVLPTGQDRIFRFVKWAADCKLGIPNHCVLVDKFAKGNPQYMANNALKVNLKLGVAAIVASIDGRLGQWAGASRIQTSKKEILENLQDMMVDRLHRWQKVNKTLPTSILVYRDGVSEGQYNDVMTAEMSSIRDAIKRVYQGSSPKITFIIVTKRHHVRFYPTSSEGCDDKNNCKNGTIIDRVVTRPWYYDFYLQAQAPLQGSARPAHYVVLHDEIFAPTSRTAADDLQQLTHNICYMMARCTRSISYATPAFLADRYCDRARKHVVAYYEWKEAQNPFSKRASHKPSQSDVMINSRLAETMVYI
ncbi:hypothetical protein N7509_006893 [Penicillium cosmopolitanum]|uniref:Piwi domain-containing protein n=1 Tax=Penicillium cosmopolitanum TaxID=1131564 RepID=A0A9X0B7Y9_9EURO|nr:uncharacterized protein N7509_006893 [Penicillium cosmopolitanum]KAJ5391403.1 hypothetical protein N7509_006893 [Penicillium cosmopolitanum]